MNSGWDVMKMAVAALYVLLNLATLPPARYVDVIRILDPSLLLLNCQSRPVIAQVLCIAHTRLAHIYHMHLYWTSMYTYSLIIPCNMHHAAIVSRIDLNVRNKAAQVRRPISLNI